METAFRFGKQEIYDLDTTFGKYGGGHFDTTVIKVYAGPFLKEYLRIQYGWYFEGCKRLKHMDIDLSGRFKERDRQEYEISELVGKKVGMIESWRKGEWHHECFSYYFILDEEDNHYKLTVLGGVKVDGVNIKNKKSVTIPKTCKKIKLATHSISTF